MALQKAIKQEDGVTTNYHRILFIQSTINSHDSIVVISYIDKESRDSESPMSRVYQSAITYEKDYVKNMTIESAYAYLKTLPVFEGAEDILEDDEESDEISGDEFIAMIEEVM